MLGTHEGAAASRPAARARDERDHDLLSALVTIEGGLRALQTEPGVPAAELVEALILEVSMARSLLSPVVEAPTPPAPPVSCRVLVVDDHALVASGLVVALQGAGLDAEVCVPTSAASVLEVARQLRPQVVLLDLVLEGVGVSALELIQPLIDLDAEVVAFTGSNDATLLAAVVELGVNGILHKSTPFDQLVDGVRRAARHEALLGARLRSELREQAAQHRRHRDAELAPFTTLTPREAAVLVRLMEGESAEAIAEASFVSLATVRTQIRGVLTKLGVSSQLAAVAMAHRAGWAIDLRDGR